MRTAKGFGFRGRNVDASPGGTRQRTALLPFLGSAILALAGVAASAQPAPGGTVPKEDPWATGRSSDVSIEIPPVADRPLGIDVGPRVRVDSFTLNVDSKLEQYLPPKLRAELQGALDAEVGRQDAQGFSIGQMEQVTNALTRMLRDGGFIVAYAYLPTQEVQGGNVEIGVLSGSLGNVVVEGNELLSDERIALNFNYLKGKPLQKQELESAILQLRDYPGLAPAAVLSAGADVGTTDLTLRVSERRFGMQTWADNYGSENTGEYRARVKFDWNSPLRRGDRLTVNLLQTFDPADGTYGGVQYETPVGYRGTYIGAAYDQNSFDSQIALSGSGVSVDTEGETETAQIYVRQMLMRGREMNMDLVFDLSTKSTFFDTSLLEDEQNDNLTVASLLFNFEAVDRLGPLGVNSLTIGYHRGFEDFLGSMDEAGINDDDTVSSRVGASGVRAGGDFDKYTLQYQRLQQLTLSNSLLFRGYYQYTSDLLTSLEQMSLGGPYSVRAYPNAQELVDRGYFMSMEYTYNAASLFNADNWDLNLSAFYDYSYGEKQDAFANENDAVRLEGYGVGVHFEYRWDDGSGFVVRGEVATPQTELDANNDRDPQYWVRFEYFRR